MGVSRYRIHKNFGKIKEIQEIPNLIDLQKNSYEMFLQSNVKPEDRKNVGLQAVFTSMFPVKDYAGRAELHFHQYHLEPPKYFAEECSERSMTYCSSLKVILRLIVWDTHENTRTIRDIKEQEVYMGDVPLMTENGTFIINGIERVVISQMHRSPGVFFGSDLGKTHSSGKFLYHSRIIPQRGSWISFEFDAKDVLYSRVDGKRKFPGTTILMCLKNPETNKEFTREDILSLFYGSKIYSHIPKSSKLSAIRGMWKTDFVAEKWQNVKLVHDLIDAKTGKVLVESGKKVTSKIAKTLKEEGVTHIAVSENDLLGSFIAKDLINEKTGEIYVEAGDELTQENISVLLEAGYKDLPVLNIDYTNVGAHIRNTLAIDKNHSREEALIDIHKILRPGEPVTPENADHFFEHQFFDPERYDLSIVGRAKLNARLDIVTDEDLRILTSSDVLTVVKYLTGLRDGRGHVDDIDSLANRRVRSVGELLENQYRIGLARMERTIRDRMSGTDIDTLMPNNLINARPVSAAIREFFGSSQLSQFMDQHNPLAEITHKRRLSALGPGGLTRERAGFEVRDVHPTHYGRICPIETPEGPNIGLINSLSTYSKINKYGFIETPYRKVVKGKATSEVVYMTAMEEEKYVIAQLTTKIDKDGNLLEENLYCRVRGENVIMPRSEAQYLDISPKQLVSVAASLIPFLENDDATRALMGSNMQRQAVPLLKTQAPLICTGMEKKIAKDSGVVVVAKHDGVVDQIDAKRIVVRVTDPKAESGSGVDIYNLMKYQRSNHSTCINQKPLVKLGDTVKAGDIIADGPATDQGELSLGRNVLVAFMPWHGYTFEDSIVISEKLVQDDVFTSIHIEEFEMAARDTKLGSEEITRSLPNVSEESLRNLDEAGIIHIGAEVRTGDILVGKVTPKGEGITTPEEKLLRAIFGEKVREVKDSSLRLPPGFSGTVVGVRVLSRRGVDKDERALMIERLQIDSYAKDRDAELQIIESNFHNKLFSLLKGQKYQSGISKGGPKEGATLSEDALNKFTYGQWAQIVVQDTAVNKVIKELKSSVEEDTQAIRERFENKVEKLRKGDDLPPGVMKVVKVFVAVKRKLQPGDKMAGRHGNKGVVAIIVPEQDMPYLEDGRTIDLILNPLGLPSRMNLGQILETHLGWASYNLGKQIGEMADQVRAGALKAAELKKKILPVLGEDHEDLKKVSDEDVVAIGQKLRSGIPMTLPVFDSPGVEEVSKYLDMAGLDTSGQVTLYDGKTGEAFNRKVTVGIIYMLKLGHLVDDKMHARSTGTYSLVTQQPLGGKAQFGGQRFGEMEVWALFAYGAAYTLREILTIKSDDVTGRTKTYEEIVRGEYNFKPGIPASFKVLMQELRALGLNFEIAKNVELEDSNN